MSHVRNTSDFTLNFRENYTQALVISKRLKFPQGDPRTETNFTAPPRMLF